MKNKPFFFIIIISGKGRYTKRNAAKTSESRNQEPPAQTMSCCSAGVLNVAGYTDLKNKSCNHAVPTAGEYFAIRQSKTDKKLFTVIVHFKRSSTDTVPRRKSSTE